MSLQTLVDATTVRDWLTQDRSVRILDCRARLGDPDAGRRLWREGHLPGSRHLDLEADLSDPAGEGGRHPLPDPGRFTATLHRLGITPAVPVIVYDDAGGQLAAARAWWLLHVWAGHPDVRVLDGGIAAWQDAGGALESGEPVAPVAASNWEPTFDGTAWISADTVAKGELTLVDARTRERYRGEVEPIDPVAGHIPEAVCRPSAANLDAEGRFKTPSRLDAELPQSEASYCGSGVTACHNILAYAIAGRALPKLYAGSWSHWIRDPARPVATGD
ncbi:sulfurtransferase [Modicisalibacter tunisiensis]|uniref:Sulfurtransferase n=1 Tax=Modicisalibacter tunisiensis TaxID=390637 RepID=A0ABS7X1A6_9GAMM|nr:sulfurtransferase [Modicisalibacter tunisiensis]MBZ9568675.1 sulfurtransferase [Modicisalibacter tunisiensis]